MKKVKWRWDSGCYLCFCPYCDKPVFEEYGTEKCCFCNQPFKWVEGRHKPRKVTVGKYTVIQTTGNSIYIHDGERMVLHASCTKRKSKRQLKKMVKGYEMLVSDDFMKGAPNE